MSTSLPSIPRLDLIPVRSVMHRGLVACDPGDSLTEIARLFAEERIHCVVVSGIEHTRHGERLTWGIVSDHDLVRALDATNTTATAATLAATEFVTIEPEERLDHAVQLMAEYDITHLVVTEGGLPVGVVSSLDVARAACAG